MEDNLEPISEEPKDDFMKASADEWSEAPVPPAPPKPEPTDRWGSPEPAAEEDASRWQGEIYSPESDTAAEGGVVIDVPSSGAFVPPLGASVEEKKKFPVWAIILIVVLVLCICVACPITLILTGALSVFNASSFVLPLLI